MTLRKTLFTPLEAAELMSILSTEYLPIHTVAAMLNVSRLTLAKWRLQRIRPPFVQLKGAVIAYPRDGFERYLKSRAQADDESIREGRLNAERLRRYNSAGMRALKIQS